MYPNLLNLMAALLKAYPGAKIFDPAAGDGEVLATAYLHTLEAYTEGYRERIYPPPELYAQEQDPYKAFLAWANLATLLPGGVGPSTLRLTLGHLERRRF